jgi:hypothetical protein
VDLHDVVEQHAHIGLPPQDPADRRRDVGGDSPAVAT